MFYGTGITFGAFDLLHAGHVHFLKQSKQLCENLIVGLHVNPALERKTKNVPIQSLYERYLQLEGCRYVDKIIPYQYEYEIDEILKTNNTIEIRFLGEDYKNATSFTGQEYCSKVGITIFYIARQHDFSSTELRERIYKNGLITTNNGSS